VGYQTPQSKVLWGIKSWGTTFKCEYLHELKTEFKNILGCKFGDYMGSICGRGPKSRATVPLIRFFFNQSRVSFMVKSFIENVYFFYFAYFYDKCAIMVTSNDRFKHFKMDSLHSEVKYLPHM
jgi:hypothetical protein